MKIFFSALLISSSLFACAKMDSRSPLTVSGKHLDSWLLKNHSPIWIIMVKNAMIKIKILLKI
ncbi:hypothetical protein HZA55_06985 [Candidatus Poribacteria bacterium]|nr:hypothetical protein [Candidatus Poribacteria bacterium]